MWRSRLLVYEHTIYQLTLGNPEFNLYGWIVGVLQRCLKKDGCDLSLFFSPTQKKKKIKPSGICFYSVAVMKTQWRIGSEEIFLCHCFLNNIQSVRNGTGLLGLRPPCLFMFYKCAKPSCVFSLLVWQGPDGFCDCWGACQREPGLLNEIFRLE